VGRRDEATTGDLVAVLIKEVGLAREAIGRIELRETFSLVEVPAGDAERVARALTGLTVRRRKLVARVDRGMPARGDRGDRERPKGPRR
jgi:ATP-dependent RNA helicase DeaD